ncbi:hypothetical protein BADO_1500 [Bifidobacterium adolescentis]|nr:hypothetical protein BADO_1500 [Bifidobacterium adolescentis]
MLAGSSRGSDNWRRIEVPEPRAHGWKRQLEHNVATDIPVYAASGFFRLFPLPVLVRPASRRCARRYVKAV